MIVPTNHYNMTEYTIVANLYKVDIIHTFIIDSKSSIVDITKTWSTNNDSSIPSQLTHNFDIIQVNRLSPSRGGRLAIIYSSECKLLPTSIPYGLMDYIIFSYFQMSTIFTYFIMIMYSYKIYYYSCIYLFIVLLYQLDAHKRLSFSLSQ